jgi:predicted patatin/cPLA2 family phospholipase
LASEQVTLRQLLAGEEPVALVAQGGGMRGTYSIAALAALEQEGFTGRFADLYGTSAGALNSAYFVAGQAAAGVDIYVDYLSNERFINLRRVRRIIDIDYLIDEVLRKSVRLKTDRVEALPCRLHVGLTSVTTGLLDWVDVDRDTDIFEVMRATAALPVVFGREISVGGDRYVDGGLLAPVPLQRALRDGYKNLVVVLTRPPEFVPQPPNALTGALIRIAARCQRHSRQVVSLLGGQMAHLGEELAIIRTADFATNGLRIWTVAPSADIAARLTRDRAILEQTASIGRADALHTLDTKR